MFKIVVGCYEKIVLGYNVEILKSSVDNCMSLAYEQQFSDHSHLGCIRCVASNKLQVVSGSTDESLSIFNMKTNSDLGPLQGHTGSVNEIVIPESMGNRILSCGDDGNICVWEVGKKKKGLIRMLRGHKGPIDSLAVHPTGKLAMSASKSDGSLRTWNLITGRSAFVKNTKRAQIEFIRWGPVGDYYVTASSRFVQVYDVATAKCVTEWETSQPILTIKFLPLIHSSKNEFVAIGDTNGYISIHAVPSGSLLLRYKAHENRVKDICSFIPSEIKQSCHDEVWLVSVCSDGTIKIWKLDSELLSRKIQEPTAKCLLTIDTEARLTCVTVWQGVSSSTQKNESTVDVSSQVVERIASKPIERLEVIYDQKPNDEIDGSNIIPLSQTSDRNPISNQKIKTKQAKQPGTSKKARLQKLRAALKETSNEEQSACSDKHFDEVASSVKPSITKKKRKVKFLTEDVLLDTSKMVKKVKTVEKSPERGRKRQRKIRSVK